MSSFFKRITIALWLLVATTTNSYAQSNTAQSPCSNKADINFTNVLPCYREELATQPLKYSLLSKEKLPQIELRHYQLTSQFWSPGNVILPAEWQHNVDIFIPDHPLSQRALVIVNNGTNYNSGSEAPVLPTDFSATTLAAIARATNTIVISISNIPNQYLVYRDDGKPRKEDDSIAHSWTLFMSEPEKQSLIPLRIPMVTSVSQAITLAQQELTSWNINKFIVSGASKRGWTTWLSAIADTRVDAIVPFIIDILGTHAAFKHVYESYGKNWPIAFYPYYQEHVDEKVDTPAFAKLMQIEDPLQYLGSIYESRLAIPKYIVNASGDDYFAPDNARFYYDTLPGDKSLRVAPNSDHRGIRNFTEQSLITFINRLQQSIPLPKLNVTLHAQQNSQILTVTFSEKPEKVIRWTATNPISRDFRYACGIRYKASPFDMSTTQQIEISLNSPNIGWEATYIEATFSDGYVATTRVYITPDDKYPVTAPLSSGPTCQTLPGRGLGSE
ncbi:PhoPQ-regulated protein [Photorhabdus luminescens subsp. luminescens]|uniref:PhoPQ-activated pathogenicity-related protein n=1 Tax=Photorhabdus luminescens TaxID=29488 RepID=A0A1G5PPL3_PHOLU|nr:PhoPQ-activated protein PqaA family protein [Photorhabdus luminescens]KMW74604.1 PhoPQ-regulated protein [Photorhabdus luminescens subsp. luminescens]SCZ51484.1 PhoPQ-activated pathogenicity-related protein [Photorhabdus luminescens]